ncbi:MAG: Gfo/Idh/MocA family protein [Kiritimatiellia bacterium]
MRNNRPRICVVGAGDWSTRMHLPAMKALGEEGRAEYVAVCDLDETKAARYARELGARAFTDLDEMLRDVRPDGLVLVANSSATPELIALAIARRMPFLCEKPPATDTVTHRRLLEQVGQLPHVVGYNRRHAPYMTKVKEWLAEEQLVSVTGLFARYRRREEFSSTAVHGIDAVLYLSGDCLAEARVEIAPAGEVWNFFVSGWTRENVRVDLIVTPDTATNEEHYIVRGLRRSARVAFPHHTTVDFPGGVVLFEDQRCVAQLGPEQFGIARTDAPRIGGIVAEHERFVNLLNGSESRAISTLRTSLPTQELRGLLQNRAPARTHFHWEG